MMRSLRLVPIGRPSSKICTSSGADTAIQPETGAFAFGVALIGTTSDAVRPDSTITDSLTDARSLSRTTACSPGVSSTTVIGVVPRGMPSTVTRAPLGSERIWSCPVLALVFGSSMYCVACVPAVMVTGIVRGSPGPRSSTTCSPADSVSVSGVMPFGSLSTKTATPSGLLVMTSVPVAVSTFGAARREAPVGEIAAAEDGEDDGRGDELGS